MDQTEYQAAVAERDRIKNIIAQYEANIRAFQQSEKEAREQVQFYTSKLELAEAEVSRLTPVDEREQAG